MSVSDFPKPIKDENGLLYFSRFDVENYKRRMMGLEPREPYPDEPITFLSAGHFAREIAISRRQLGRKMAKAATQAADPDSLTGLESPHD